MHMNTVTAARPEGEPVGEPMLQILDVHFLSIQTR